jgi:polyhydroxyalkanoate synthesis regulator phasin
MKKGTKWIYMIVGGFLAIGLIAGAGLVFLRSEAASLRVPAAASAYATGLQSGWFGDDDRPMGKYEEALADALGISVEKLQAAYDAIWKASIDAAVDEGKLTDDQAEQMLGRGGFAMRGRRAPIGLGSEMNELLANELGISVSTLEAAQEKAHEILIAEAIASGDLSEDQAALMQAHQLMGPYMQAAMADAFENAVDKALSEGAITQIQADLLLENGGPGTRGPGMFPGSGGIRGRGGFAPGGRIFGSDEG